MLRIAQIIDSLEAGGAETMAVNYANAIAKRSDFSGLVVTRTNGSLRSKLHSDVKFLHLQRKHSIDIGAVLRLRRYCVENNIDLLHAHSSSFFIATLLKCTLPRIKLIWHDHYGMSDALEQRPKMAIKVASAFFSGIISVNQKLMKWANTTLICSNITYLENFAAVTTNAKPTTTLNGIAKKRIVCVANLRPQKNHPALIRVGSLLAQAYPEWTIHLVGKDFGDAYAATIKQQVVSAHLENIVYFYGSQPDTVSILEQCEIFVLPSLSEGLPVSLLEAGMARLATVATNVGEISEIVQNANNGFLVAVNDDRALFDAIVKYINDADLRSKMADALYDTIKDRFSEEAVLEKYFNWLNTIK